MSHTTEALGLLTKAAEQFRYYERNHRAKVLVIEENTGGMADDKSRQLRQDTLQKAEVNAALAAEIEEFLSAG